MQEVLESSFVYAKDAVKVKTFLGNVLSSIECINYMDIYNKLVKNDYLQSEPSTAVVSSYLMRQIQSAITKNTTRSLFYVLGELDEEVIMDIKDYVRSLTSKTIHYKIYHAEDANIKRLKFLFNETVEF